jgi:hypothetical protein
MLFVLLATAERDAADMQAPQHTSTAMQQAGGQGS